MNQKHTPEPWSVDEHGVIIGDGLTSVAETYLKSWSGTAESAYGSGMSPMMKREMVANGRHIVKCVNNCAGINPEAVPSYDTTVREIVAMEARHPDRDFPTVEEWRVLVKMAHVTLAKAERKES